MPLKVQGVATIARNERCVRPLFHLHHKTSSEARREKLLKRLSAVFLRHVHQVSLCACRSVVGVLLRPLLGLIDGSLLVSSPVVGNCLIEWVVAVGCRHQGLDREEHGLDLEGGRPLVLKNVKADATYIQT